MTTVPEALLEAVRGGHRFVVVSHVSPDGDAIGTGLATARVLQAMGKGAVVWNRDVTPPLFNALPGSDRIHTGTEPPAGFPDAFDHAIVLECPQLDRTGIEARLDPMQILNIDHHLGNEQYGKVNWVDTAAPAVGELVYRLARAAHVEVDELTASLLLLTLVTDTGGFRFSNATDRAFESAAELVRDGARPELVAEWLYENRTLPSLRLVGAMLETLAVAPDEPRIATAVVTQAMYAATGATAADTEGLVDYPRSIAGVRAVALLRQLDEPSNWKVSLRSRGDVDVQRLALQHDGGGHRNAAGCQLQGPLETVRNRIVSELASLLES
jgi:phosphoesterase RecJ-like protein